MSGPLPGPKTLFWINELREPFGSERAPLGGGHAPERFRRIQMSDFEPPARHWCRECANEESANDCRRGHGRINFE